MLTFIYWYWRSGAAESECNGWFTKTKLLNKLKFAWMIAQDRQLHSLVAALAHIYSFVSWGTTFFSCTGTLKKIAYTSTVSRNFWNCYKECVLTNKTIFGGWRKWWRSYTHGCCSGLHQVAAFLTLTDFKPDFCFYLVYLNRGHKHGAVIKDPLNFKSCVS